VKFNGEDSNRCLPIAYRLEPLQKSNEHFRNGSFFRDGRQLEAQDFFMHLQFLSLNTKHRPIMPYHILKSQNYW